MGPWKRTILSKSLSPQSDCLVSISSRSDFYLTIPLPNSLLRSLHSAFLSNLSLSLSFFPFYQNLQWTRASALKCNAANPGENSNSSRKQEPFFRFENATIPCFEPRSCSFPILPSRLEFRWTLPGEIEKKGGRGRDYGERRYNYALLQGEFAPSLETRRHEIWTGL